MIVKDIRYIIKRIIIGVGIALILMLIKGNLFLHVSALSSNTQTITASSHRVNDTVTGVTLSSRNIFGFTFYGADYNNTTGRVTYNTTNNLDTSNLYDISFVIYQSNAGKNGNSPVVTYNDNVCSVLPFGTLVSYDETSNLPLFSAFGGWTAPGAITSSGIQSFVEYYQMHPTYSTFSFGYMVSCSSVEVKDLNQTKVYTSQSTCGESSCYYGLSSEFWSRQSNESLIINNQNENTQKEIESQKACTTIDKNDIVITDKFLKSDGSLGSSSGFGITDYYLVSNSNIKVVTFIPSYMGLYSCFYSSDKSLISCISSSQSVGTSLTIPSNSNYVRFSIQISQNRPTYEFCRSGNQVIAEQNQQMQNTLNDTSTTQADSDASDFFGNFSSNSHGLSGIISAPLRLIQSISSSSCSALTVPLPFVNENVSLPCMSTIYTTHFNTFLTLYRLITTGLISYWVCIRLFSKVKDFQNPDNDRIEVLDL